MHQIPLQYRVTVHSITKLPKLRDIKIFTNGQCNTFKRSQLLLKDGIESIYAPVTFRGHFLLESAIFALILSNAMPEDFITARSQTDNQIIMNEMNKTENEAESRMNETENSQTEEIESTIN